MLDIGYPRDLVKTDVRKSSDDLNLQCHMSACNKLLYGRRLYALLNCLNVFVAHAYAPRSSQMPPGFPLQVLDHDAGEHDYFRVDVIEDLTVGEVQAVGDVSGDPCLEAG